MLVENIADVFMEHKRPGLLSSLVLNVRSYLPLWMWCQRRFVVKHVCVCVCVIPTSEGHALLSYLRP